MWRKSETEIAGIQQVDGAAVEGCGLDVVGVRGEKTSGEGTRSRLGQYSRHQRGMKMGGPEDCVERPFMHQNSLERLDRHQMINTQPPCVPEISWRPHYVILKYLRSLQLRLIINCSF